MNYADVYMLNESNEMQLHCNKITYTNDAYVNDMAEINEARNEMLVECPMCP